MVKVLRDIYLDAGKIDSYFEGSVPADLWRARKKSSVEPIFTLVEEKFILSSGRPREADIEIDRSGVVPWVRVELRAGGISTWDRSGVFKGSGWEYYKIPEGMSLPEGLAITKDYFNPRMNAWHYTISPARDMPLQHFKDLLRQLATQVLSQAA